MRPSIVRLVLMLALLGVPRAGESACIRSPQVPFPPAQLQALLDRVDGGIGVLTDQLVSSSLAPPAGNVAFTLRARSRLHATTVGLYAAADGASPQLLPLLPAAAPAGWFADVFGHTATGPLTVILLDSLGVVEGMGTYPAIALANFGFYAQRDGATWFEQDARNGGLPQVLGFGATGVNAGELWLCFADSAYAPDTSTFADVVLELASPPDVTGWLPRGCATPARTPTWGRLKAAYR